MNIISINVNGIRAFDNKWALSELLNTFDPDILCLQETKCDEDTLKAIISWYNDNKDYANYVVYANSSKGKTGYAGVAIIIREEFKDKFEVTPIDICKDDDSDDFKYYATGRIIKLSAAFQLINVYTMNSGGKEELRKLFNQRFNELVSDELSKNPNLIITGDLNVVATHLDYWGNYNANIDSGPGLYQFEIDDFHERSKKFELIDTFRDLHPSQKSYSWYSYRGGAYKYNKGWRLDYFLVTKNVYHHVVDSKIHQNFLGSDHRPIELILQ